MSIRKRAEVQKVAFWQIIQKDSVLLVGRLERATLLFSGIQRTESVGDNDEGEKSGENFLLGKVSFARAFGTA